MTPGGVYNFKHYLFHQVTKMKRNMTILHFCTFMGYALRALFSEQYAACSRALFLLDLQNFITCKNACICYITTSRMMLYIFDKCYAYSVRQNRALNAFLQGGKKHSIYLWLLIIRIRDRSGTFCQGPF